MSNLVLSLFQEVNGGHLGPYNPNASEWWAWAGATCFLVGVLGFRSWGSGPRRRVAATSRTRYS
jgi:hypothetical protein